MELELTKHFGDTAVAASATYVTARNRRTSALKRAARHIPDTFSENTVKTMFQIGAFGLLFRVKFTNLES